MQVKIGLVRLFGADHNSPWHDPKRNGYGFIAQGDGAPDVYFHVAQGRRCSSRGGTTAFAEEPIDRLPKAGDRVCYVLADDGAKTPHAIAWGFAADDFRFGPHRAPLARTARPPHVSTMYRFVKRAEVDGVMDEERASVFWIGSNPASEELESLMLGFGRLPARFRLTDTLAVHIRLEYLDADDRWLPFIGVYDEIVAGARVRARRLAA